MANLFQYAAPEIEQLGKLAPGTGRHNHAIQILALDVAANEIHALGAAEHIVGLAQGGLGIVGGHAHQLVTVDRATDLAALTYIDTYYPVTITNKRLLMLYL